MMRMRNKLAASEDLYLINFIFQGGKKYFLLYQHTIPQCQCKSDHVLCVVCTVCIDLFVVNYTPRVEMMP